MARVLLVEDDEAIRRFVELALEDCDVEMIHAATLGEARTRLRDAGPFALILSDLMLPDGSGTDLLRTLQADPALRAGARLAVFSAGVSAARREELRGLGVTHVVEKPASVGALTACVRDALEPHDTAPPPPGPAAADEAGAIARHFGGNAAMFDAFRTLTRKQLANDLRAGDDALERADRAALRRTAHNLKSVLRLLGHADASVLAKALEAAAAGDTPVEDMAAQWQSLRAAVGATMAA